VAERVTGQEGMTRLAATVERLRGEVQEAQATADGRALIELAKGILVERLRCGPVQAAHQLDVLAEQAGVSLLELAADVVNDVAQDRLTDVSASIVDRVWLRSTESGVLAAGDTQAVAQSLLDQALVPLGAAAVAVWAVDADTSLTLAGFAGFPASEAARWRHVPPGVATPARRALTGRTAVWLTDLARSGLPSIGQPSGGRVAAPAVIGGRIIAILEIGWTEPLGPQSVAIHRQVDALAELCAHTLHVSSADGLDRELAQLADLADGILDSTLVLRPHLDADGRLTDFVIHHANTRFVDLVGRPRGAVVGTRLLEAYPMSADQGGLFEKIEHVHATGEPFRADNTMLATVVDQVPMTLPADISINRHGDAVLLIWRLQDETTRLASLLHHAQRLGRIGGFDENVVTGEVTWNSQLFELYGIPPTEPPVPLDQLAAQAHPDDGRAIGRFLRTVLHHRRPASAAFRLRRPDGVARHVRVVAEPVLDNDNRLLHVRGAYQDISSQHWTEVALSATRDQLAQTEQHAAESDKLALQLQRAIMPSSPDPIDTFGMSIAVRYLPAESGALVGGDWYDAVVLPSKKILLSVGDIAGHGIEAATGMVVLRNALRGLAATGAGPGQLLTWLNLVAHHLTNNVMATAVCGLYDPETRTLRWARAGHPPPVLVRGGEADLLPMLRGTMLGVMSEAVYQEDQLSLESDDMLVLYTDGLIERRDRSLDDALAQLVALASTTTGSLEQRLEHLLTYSNADTDDDTCIVAVQLR
jgi:serine phosphatase RsbU (regulator of sigma subunit)